MLKSSIALIAAVIISMAAFLVSGCGNGSGTASPTRSAGSPTVPSPLSSAVSGGTTPAVNATYGPTPQLKDNIEQIQPKWGEKVTQASTRTPDAGVPHGTCVKANFKGLAAGNLQWFRMAFDGVEVTSKLLWAVDSFEKPTGGTVCYSLEQGFPVGRHFVAISVQDPAGGPVKQVVSWGFEVTP